MTKKKPGARRGRPTIDPKGERAVWESRVRLSQAAGALVEAAAEAAGVAVGAWLRDAVLVRLKKTLRKGAGL